VTQVRDAQELGQVIGECGGARTTFIHGEPVYYLGRDEMAAVEHAVTNYLGR
jgi:hypothetical protein